MSVINTNISSIQAQNSMRLNQLSQSSAMERLASGVRINSAKDDAAGLAIGTRMTANIRGLAAAVRNANDGISLTQTAEGSLGQISDNLQRIRELAVQSANTGNNASDRAAMNNEASQLIAEIDRVASNTSFNSINLLDGTFTAQALQVGAGNTANDRLVISIGNAKSSALGVGASSSYAATKSSNGTVTSTAFAVGALSLNGFQVGASVTDGVSFTNASASGIAKAAAINAISAQSGVTATVSSTTHTGSAATVFTATVADDLLINGVDIGALGAATAAGDRGTQTAAAVNAKTSQTGVTATVTSAGLVTLTAADGRNISVSGTSNGMDKTGLGNLNSIAATAVTTPGAVLVNTVTLGGAALAATNTFALNGLTFTSDAATTIAQVAAAFANVLSGETAAQVTARNTTSAALGKFSGTFTAGFSTGASTTTTIVATSAAGNSTNIVATGAVTTQTTAVTTAAATEVSTVTVSRALTQGESLTVGGLTYTATAANSIAQVAAAFASLSNGATTGAGTALGRYSGSLTDFTTGAGTGTTIVATSTTSLGPVTDLAISSGTGNYSSSLTLSSSQSGGITLGGTSGLAAANLSVTAATATATASAGVSSLDLTTVSGSQAALATLDRAINTITDSRASMGAYQNRLTASISNLETTSQNMQASRSRIMDTNYAQESTKLAKSQIISQAATAMLAQANQSQQSVLALLK
jgi:flagellin